MPLRPGENVGTAIRELHTGKAYARTKRKYGKKRANLQAIAIAERNRRTKKRGKRSRKRARK